MKLAITTLLAAAVAALFFMAAPSTATTTLRSWPVPPGWHAPPSWLGHPATSTAPPTGAWCIHEHEGAWNSIGYVRGVATYGGGMQFMLGTWRGAGGTAGSLWDIARASPREQLYRAWIVWQRDHDRWSAEWGTAGVCGLA